eukprot:CAMPEP_0181108086 /NCGR_PEP_ID=MMETSP1071-20121207/17440_1 /TAXON_ID=35127 /ORGANISM="Thalassiosira sp., Strain NH16" /LENGTH=165 /DNA_ID=CAMNT_0023191661 /DNA_START=241 /DNA_END=735 /DNA_ORIENTATION=+
MTKKKSAGGVGGGLDEIDSLFAQKKQSDKEIHQQISEEKELAKQERKRRKQARLEEEADEIALRRSSSSVAAAGGSASAGAGARKGDATAPAALHAKAKKLSSLTYTRSDLDKLNDNPNNKEAKDKWASDGLGGVFNGEGYTGRRDDGGHRVFKEHLMNKKRSGE